MVRVCVILLESIHCMSLVAICIFIFHLEEHKRVDIPTLMEIRSQLSPPTFTSQLLPLAPYYHSHLHSCYDLDTTAAGPAGAVSSHYGATGTQARVKHSPVACIRVSGEMLWNGCEYPSMYAPNTFAFFSVFTPETINTATFQLLRTKCYCTTTSLNRSLPLL